MSPAQIRHGLFPYHPDESPVTEGVKKIFKKNNQNNVELNNLIKVNAPKVSSLGIFSQNRFKQ